LNGVCECPMLLVAKAVPKSMAMRGLVTCLVNFRLIIIVYKYM